jgi:hypothetical protein
MRNLDFEVQQALAKDTIAPRDFLWITVRERDTGNPVSYGAWSDAGAISADVINPADGTVENRTYRGVGAILEIGPVALVTGLIVQNVSIRLNHLDADTVELVRGYDARRAPIELHRGYLDTQTMRLLSPAVPVFSGFVDSAPIETPVFGNEGSIELICASHTQDLTRSNSAKRSDADQRLRNGSDGFFRHAATVGGWTITWGAREG